MVKTSLKPSEADAAMNAATRTGDQGQLLQLLVHHTICLRLEQQETNAILDAIARKAGAFE